MNMLFLNRKFSLPGLILVSGFSIWAVLGLQGCGGGDGFIASFTLCEVEQESALDSQARIGGSTTVAVLIDPTDPTDNWTLYNVANELRSTQVGITESAKFSLLVDGFIHDIDVVEYPAASGTRYALLSMGDKGIAVVNVTDPTNMVAKLTVHVNYEKSGITWTDGGGNVSELNTISGMHGTISSLEVYDDGVGPMHLLIGNSNYGLHKTLLSNLIDGVTEADGSLLIDSETYTLQYAGENPWGGPESLTLYRDPDDGTDKGKLFVAMGFLGMGIFDPETLGATIGATAADDQIGGYNLYLATDSTEDWFVNADGSNLDPADQVQEGISGGSDGEGVPWTCAAKCLDDFTGMPDYRQAAFEITEVWHNKNPGDDEAPWAAFDRYGKFYYRARKVDVATFDSGLGTEKTIAYIAYALGGLQAIDVTGYKTAGPYVPTDDLSSYDDGEFRKGARLGYAPAVPANGPDAPTGAQSKSLFPYFGAGMLKESGIVDVKVDVASNTVFFSDHFAGLVAIGPADNPLSCTGADSASRTCVGSTWNGTGGSDTGGSFDNDPLNGPGGAGLPVLGDHWPDYEFVDSYDMTPFDPNDNESLPKWMYESPTLLLSGEVSGHGNSFLLMPNRNVGAGGEVDVVMTSGGGGLNFIDITDITDCPRPDTGTCVVDGFTIPVHMATTDAAFREADGSVTVGAAVGHTAGVTVYRDKLFLADGPHGMTVWQVAEEKKCLPFDDVADVRLVANTLQDEYAVTVDGVTINPAPHAYDIVLDSDNELAYVLSQSRGLRRVDTAATSTGEIPVLLQVGASDIYEHNTDTGETAGGLKMQDHAYDVALDGNLAFVADGSNGLTVYDIGQAPTVVVGNVGGTNRAKPELGHATAVKLWRDTENAKKYAFVAAGHAGIGVVDVTDAANMLLIKVFEPIKTEVHEDEPQYNKADGKSVDVIVVDDHAYFTYDSFGVVAYKIADLVKPLSPQYANTPTKIWDRGEIGDRPVAVARFKLQDPELFGSAELSELGGGSQGMFFLDTGDKHLFYVAYDSAGVAKIDWTDVTRPVLVQHADTAGNASDVEVASGRAYVADGGGGLVIMK